MKSYRGFRLELNSDLGTKAGSEVRLRNSGSQSEEFRLGMQSDRGMQAGIEVRLRNTGWECSQTEGCRLELKSAGNEVRLRNSGWN